MDSVVILAIWKKWLNSIHWCGLRDASASKKLSRTWQKKFPPTTFLPHIVDMLHKDFRIILNLKTPPTASCSMVKGRTFLLMKILRGIFEESLVNFKREKDMLYDNRDFFKHLFCPLALRDAVLTQNGSFYTQCVNDLKIVNEVKSEKRCFYKIRLWIVEFKNPQQCWHIKRTNWIDVVNSSFINFGVLMPSLWTWCLWTISDDWSQSRGYL